MADNRGIPQDPYNAPYPSNYPNQPQNNAGYPNQAFPSDPYQNTPQGAPVADPYAPAPSGFDPYAAPQMNPNYPVDPYSQPTVMADPYATPAASTGAYDPYSQSAPMNDPYAAQAAGNFNPAEQGYAYAPQDQYASPNTFQEKKTGNKVFLFAIIGVIVLLVSAAGVLIFLNLQGSGTPTNNNNTNNNNNNTSQVGQNPQLEPNVSKTGGNNTPATKARKSTNATLTSAWILQKFQGQPYIDSTGKCNDATRCGENADPDNDGVTNIEEFNFDIDPLNSDTDRDGIADGDELYVYYTNPQVTDSDGDTYKDFDELANCYDPGTDSKGAKMTETSSNSLDLNKIEANVELNPLKSVTQNSFRRVGASTDDISKGYIVSKCTPPAETAPEVEKETTPEDEASSEDENLSATNSTTTTQSTTNAAAVNEPRV